MNGDIASLAGGKSTELAGGVTLAINGSTSLNIEMGKLWSPGGDVEVRSPVSGTVGVRMN